MKRPDMVTLSKFATWISSHIFVTKLLSMVDFSPNLGQCPCSKYPYQGWEFSHRFSERIACFLRKNEEMSNSLKKTSDSLIRSFAHFWWATWAICSLLLIFGERPEWIAHDCSILVSDLSDSLTSLIFGEPPEHLLTSLNKKGNGLIALFKKNVQKMYHKMWF